MMMKNISWKHKFEFVCLLFAIFGVLVVSGCHSVRRRTPRPPSIVFDFEIIAPRVALLYDSFTHDSINEAKIEVVRELIGDGVYSEEERPRNRGRINLAENLQSTFEDQVQKREHEKWSKEAAEKYKVVIFGLIDRCMEAENGARLPLHPMFPGTWSW
jgi:hypothetical protein